VIPLARAGGVGAKVKTPITRQVASNTLSKRVIFIFVSLGERKVYKYIRMYFTQLLQFAEGNNSGKNGPKSVYFSGLLKCFYRGAKSVRVFSFFFLRTPRSLRFGEF
jgi:hypothetical protein